MKFLEKYKMDLIVDSRDKYKEAVLSLLEKDKNAKLLDLGCGDSRRLTNRIIEKVSPEEVHGIDLNWISPIAGMRVYQGNLNEEFQTPNGYFDIVIASQIIEHLWNTDLFIKEIYKKLKSTGYAIISTPNLASYHNILYLILGKQPEMATVSDELYPEKEEPGHRRVFTATELIKLLKFHKFKLEEVVGSSYYPFRGKLASILNKLDWKHSSIITVKVRKCHI